MSEGVLVSNGSLEQELELARSSLRDLDENIRRIYGKSEPFRNDTNDKKRIAFEGGNKKADNLRGINRSGKIFNRLGSKEEDSDDFPRPRVASRVNVTVSREDALSMQQAKKSDLARNKRMFGSLLGTLQQFRKEENKETSEKRAKIELKIEQQQQIDKEKIQQEKNSLIADRRRKQIEVKSLEMKMHKLKNFKIWEESKMKMVKFIGTKHRPQIFYLPKVMNSKTEILLKESQDELKKRIEERRQEVDEEIKQIEERLATDLKAFDEGKLKKTNDIEMENDDENDNYESDNENSISERREPIEVFDRKRKRSSSYSPEKTLRSQVVVKRANN